MAGYTEGYELHTARGVMHYRILSGLDGLRACSLIVEEDARGDLRVVDVLIGGTQKAQVERGRAIVARSSGVPESQIGAGTPITMRSIGEL